MGYQYIFRFILKSKVFWVIAGVLVVIIVVYKSYSGVVNRLYDVIDSLIERRVNTAIRDYNDVVERLEKNILRIDTNIKSLEQKNKRLEENQEKLKKRLENIGVEVMNMNIVEVAKRFKELGYESVMVCAFSEGLIKCFKVEELER